MRRKEGRRGKSKVRLVVTAGVVTLACIAIQTSTIRSALSQEAAVTDPKGTWIVLAYETATARSEPKDGEDFRLEITDKQFHWMTNGLVERVFYRIDPATPGTLDLDIRGETVWNKCLYRIEGDVLKLCIGWASGPRPKTFEMDQEPRATLVTLKRE